jgi:DNA polymerase delta subunit 4
VPRFEEKIATMPRTRKSAHRPANAQSTLSFNNRVTKSSASAQRAEAAASSKKLEQIEDTVLSEPEVATVQAEAEVEVDDDEAEGDESTIVEEQSQPTRASGKRKVKHDAKDEREVLAEKITDAQVKKYWQREEDDRLAPRGTSHFSPSLPSSLFLSH